MNLHDELSLGSRCWKISVFKNLHLRSFMAFFAAGDQEKETLVDVVKVPIKMSKANKGLQLEILLTTCIFTGPIYSS